MHILSAIFRTYKQSIWLETCRNQTFIWVVFNWYTWVSRTLG